MLLVLLTALVMSPAVVKIKQIRAKNGAACGAKWAVYYYLDAYEDDKHVFDPWNDDSFLKLN